MELIVEGKNAVFEIFNGTEFKPVICCKSFSIEAASELIEVTTLTTGIYKDYELQSLDYTINLSNVFAFVSDNIASGFLFTQQAAGGKFQYRATFTDAEANVYNVVGTAIVESSILTANPTDAVGADFVLKGCGEPTVSGGNDIDPADAIKDVFYIAEGGEETIGQIDWIGADMIDVSRNGIGLHIITAGSPLGNQVLFDSVAGSLTFGLELGEAEYIHIIYAT